ncbi:DMT family transporter [Pseudonocardia thermophila]|uniref:DMT family transporter n=1 Tax=Pseudonocardia thermophila TaxID=1848 RepID=UPI0009376053|nr:EamA family transporter [Pseudonocardia thermophila]
MTAPPAPARAVRRVGWATVAAIAFTVLAWSSAFVGIRAVTSTYAPGPMALGRLLVGVVVLGVLMLLSRQRWVAPTRREWGFLVLCGLSWFAVYNVVLAAAETRIDAGTTSILVNVGPVLIALMAGVLLGEGLPRWLIVGALVAFAGAVLVGLATSEGSADLLGVLFGLASAVTYAIGVLAQKPALRRLPFLQVTFIVCAIGAVACLPFAPSLVETAAAAPASATGWLIYLGVVPTALAYSTWAYALARVDAGRLGMSTYLVPPVTVAMSAVLLAELPPLLAIVGGVVCLSGVALSRRR